MVKLIKKEKNSEILYESDETFAFIAGYTSGGAPYGITWEEMNGADEDEMENVELPFD